MKLFRQNLNLKQRIIKPNNDFYAIPVMFMCHVRRTSTQQSSHLQHNTQHPTPNTHALSEDEVRCIAHSSHHIIQQPPTQPLRHNRHQPRQPTHPYQPHMRQRSHKKPRHPPTAILPIRPTIPAHITQTSQTPRDAQSCAQHRIPQTPNHQAHKH